MYSPLESERKILILVENCLYKSNKGSDNRKHINFRMKKIDPGELTIVVNECYKISILRVRKNMTHTPNICMNNFKTGRSLTSLHRKR